MSKTANHTIRTLLKTTIMLVILGAICLSGAAQTSTPPPQDSFSKYRIITERNIFSRQRGRRAATPRTDRERTVRQYTPPSPESYLVLKGLAKVDNVYVAFFEDTRGGALIRVTAGAGLARGRITKLNLDSVVYQRGDNKASIAIGQTLEGRLAPATLSLDNLVELARTAPIASSTQPADGNQPPAAETPPADEADILRKLMERRKQELGG